jgi:hypothetical protein
MPRGIAASIPLKLPASFTFTCYDTAFDAVVVHGSGKGARLTVRGQIGTLPYSAESATARRYMHAVVDAGRELPFAEISLTSSQAIVVRGTMDFPDQPTPASVAAGTSVIIVALKPVIDLMSACRDMAGKRIA